jgi:Tfp pilus assembly protein PilV
MRQARRAMHGFSLIEAIVALAVMAFGMLAFVGLQGTLRFNSDVSKQRSEAVRIAQQAIEEWRAFSFVEPDVDEMDYAQIATLPDVNLIPPNVNTTFTLSRTIIPAANATSPRTKTLVVDVGWDDRNGVRQSVRLSTTIAGTPPELAGALSVPGAGGPLRLPEGRSPSVPQGAVGVGGGKSAYRPPGAPLTTVWLFDNLSGVVTSVCTFPGTDLSQLVPATQCTSQPSYLISGFVRFSFTAPADADAPADEQIPLGMQAIALGVEFADGECFVAPVQDPKLTYTAYVCRVPQSADTTWTGSTLLVTPPDPMTQYDVCRYTNGQPGNANHPQVYVHLDRSLGNQNFLVVTKGVACPAGTLAHQPPLSVS